MDLATGIDLITRERNKQIQQFTKEHDAEHLDGQLSCAAASCVERAMNIAEEDNGLQMFDWPWDDGDKRFTDDRITNLVKAGALICAEIDRIKGV